MSTIAPDVVVEVPAHAKGPYLGVIYFVQSGPGGPVKIGWTYKLGAYARLRTLQVGNPVKLTLLAEFNGSEADEQALHLRFKALALRGEWFKYEEPLASYIAALPLRACPIY